jgi:DNA polymerase III subunit gamma/tau
LRTIATAEGLAVDESALTLVARFAEGSMRDAQSALDQVMAFAGGTITVDDVATVLGVVGRDLLFGIVDAVIAEDGPAAFTLADRAVEAGHDLKLVCRELTRLVRDVLMVSVDPGRTSDGELLEGERERLQALAAQLSREDLMRAFDVLSRAEQDIRTAAHPRYHFEMALLRWMHLRKLVPLTDLLAQLGGRPTSAAPAPQLPQLPPSPPASPVRSAPPRVPSVSAAPRSTPAPVRTAPAAAGTMPAPAPATSASFKDAFLAEIRASRALFYNTIVAQAQRIDVSDEAVTFTFAATHRGLREQFDQAKAWLETTAERAAGRRVRVTSQQAAGEPVESAPPVTAAAPAAPAAGARDLKAEAMGSSVVQAMLDVFPAEIRDVEEI